MMRWKGMRKPLDDEGASRESPQATYVCYPWAITGFSFVSCLKKMPCKPSNPWNSCLCRNPQWIPSHRCCQLRSPLSEAQIIAPKASEKRVSEVVQVDANYDAIPSDPALSVETLEGCKIGEGVFIVTSQGGTSLVFNDMVFNVQSVESGFARFMLRMVGSLGGPKVTRVGRTFMVNDKNALASHFAKLAMLPNLIRLIPGHGDIVTVNVADALESISVLSASPRLWDRPNETSPPAVVGPHPHHFRYLLLM